MNPPAVVKVTDPQGVHGTIDTTAWPLDDRRAAVPVALEDGRQVWVPVHLLMREAEGHYAIPMMLAELERAGADAREPPLVLPIMVEALEVHKRRVETGRVRIHTTVQTREVLVDEPLVREVVEGPIPVRDEGDTMILSLLEAGLVVETRLLVKAEVPITTRRTERHAPARVTRRREEVTIERVDRERHEPHNSGQEESHGEDRDRSL